MRVKGEMATMAAAETVSSPRMILPSLGLPRLIACGPFHTARLRPQAGSLEEANDSASFLRDFS
jgi:hypothetical protein